LIKPVLKTALRQCFYKVKTMINAEVSVAKQEISFPANDLPFFCLLSPYIHKGAVAHSTYFLDKNHSCAFRVELKGKEHHCRQVFDDAKKRLSMSPEDFPYGLTEAQWWEYALSPHSYIALGKDTYQIGLNYFNRFLHLNVRTSEAHLLDPGVDDEFLSTTNWFDAQSGELYFASWSAYETLRRNFNPQDAVRVNLWKSSPEENKPTLIWQGELGDSLHQLVVSPDRRFLVLAELGLRLHKASPNKRLVPSKVLILDLKTGREWRLELPAAAHVEFDPQDPSVCYLSAHNIGLIGPKVGIFGPGTIEKIRLAQSGPELLEKFSHPSFYRITTHIIFNDKQKTLIAVSGYPGCIFLIDAQTMQLENMIEMPCDDPVDATRLPHCCSRDSYGIAASVDGGYLFVSTTEAFKIYDLAAGALLVDEKNKSGACFTGHTAHVHAI